MSQRYTDVAFEFPSAPKALQLARGVVIVRDDEMVLEVECPGERPYTIHGKATGNFFSGRHEGLPDDWSVEAKWILLDDIYIGTWLEGGIDFLFTFRLDEPDA